MSIKTLSEIYVDYKYAEQNIGIGIPDLLMNLLLCNYLLKNIKSIAILKYPKRMLEYYFLKGFGILECNFNNLAKLTKKVKQRIHAEETDNSDYVMTCINTIPSTSNTLKKLLLHKSLHYSYIQTDYNDKGEIINNTFITYVEPLLDDFNNNALLQEWKLNLDAAAYEKIDADMYKPSAKKENYRHDSNSY